MTDVIIGYSGINLFEECYEYHEDACYIADTKEDIEVFMKKCSLCAREYRIDPIAIEQIMNDYGCSLREYAMEQGAFKKFKTIASEKGIRFRARHEQCDVSLMIVNVDGVKFIDE